MKTTKRKLKLSGTKRKKAWKPTTSQPKRRKQAAEHGDKCFLTRKRTKSGLTDYGYPVCNSAGRVTCQGTEAAYRRAKMQGKAGVASKAKRKAKQLSCGWAMKKRG
jgi:ribosomal protein L34